MSPDASDRPPKPRDPTWFEQWVLPYAREPVLWPVLLAILGHVVLLFALGLLRVWRGEGAGAAVLSAALTVGLVGLEVRAASRPGALAIALGITWALAVPLAMLAQRTGFL